MLKEFKGYHKGIDFGGWLSQCDNTKERYDTFIVESDFETVSKWGVDHVRVPIDYNLVETDDGEYKEEGFKYIQNAIDWCGKYGLNMVLDLHKTYGFSFDKHYGEMGFFENELYQERFYKLWENLATRYSKYSDRVCFELLNEVTDAEYSDTWNRISTTCIKRIRAISKDVKILIGGYWNNSAETVKFLPDPVDENVVYNFHNYDPIVFTHQGAQWIDGMPADLRVGVNTSFGEMKAILEKYVPQMAAGFAINGREDKILDAEYFKQVFAEPVRIAEERGCSLYCGEYGVIELASPEDKLAWYKCINEAFEYYGIGRATWSYKEMDFGIMNKELDGIRDELVKLF